MQPTGGLNENPPVPRSSSVQQVSVVDIVKKLDFATSENVKLKKAIEENNAFMEQKLQELSQAKSESQHVGDGSIVTRMT